MQYHLIRIMHYHQLLSAIETDLIKEELISSAVEIDPAKPTNDLLPLEEEVASSIKDATANKTKHTEAM